MANSVRGRQATGVQAIGLLLSFLLMASVGGLLMAGLVLPAVGIANGATELTVTAFDDLPSELEVKNLSEKSTVLAADGTVLAEFFEENRIVVPFDQVAPIMKQAVLATEDKRFYEHGGVDPQGMLRAGARTLAGDSEGASTLTQQYVKNILIEKATRENRPAEVAAAKNAKGKEGLARKLREAKLAISLEKRTPKDKIFEGYLNIAQFGVQVYGVESAAQRFFSKHASELNYLEAATIAGITKSPSKFDPIKNPEESQGRRATVLQLMWEQGFITRAEYDAGLATPIAATLVPKETPNSCASAGAIIAGSGYFCDYVVKVIANDSTFGATPAERKDLLLRGGLTITTTLDPREQTIADTEVKNGIPVDDASGVASAISVVEPGTGQIKALAQNRTYTTAKEPGPRETNLNLNTNQAYGGSAGFSPGSTFKPFTLVEWLKEGHSLSETIDGNKMEYKVSEFNAPCVNLGRETWKFGNAEGSKSGTMNVLDATRNSVNSAYIAMAAKLDLCKIFEGAASMGVTMANGEPYPVLASNIIGSSTVAPLTMASAFATFASGGTYCKPVAITKVVDSIGNELPIPLADCRQVLEPHIANAMNYALSNVWTGTAKSVGAPPFAAAGKTGTTTRNEHTWFVGYTPVRAAAVWVGFTEGDIPVQNMYVNGQKVRYMYGATVAAPTWKRFMVQALDGVDVPAFGAVGKTELEGVQVPVPNVIGQSVDQATKMLTDAGFSVSVAPEQVPSVAPAGLIGQQSSTGTAPRGSSITLNLSNGQMPEGGPGGPGGPGGGDDRGGRNNPGGQG